MCFSARRGSASLPAQLGVQARLQGEGVPWARWVVAKAVGLRCEALQRRRGVSLEPQRERKASEAWRSSQVILLVRTSARTCRRADCMVGLWIPLRAAGEAEGEKAGTPGKGSRAGKPLLPGGWSPLLSLGHANTVRLTTSGSIALAHIQTAVKPQRGFLFYTFNLMKSDLGHVTIRGGRNKGSAIKGRATIWEVCTV